MLTILFTVLHLFGIVHKTWWYLTGCVGIDFLLIMGYEFDWFDELMTIDFVESWFDDHDW